jgi:hypothetical protein
MGNPFDRFDTPVAGTSVAPVRTGQNPFDRFDVVSEALPSAGGALTGGIGPGFDAAGNRLRRVPKNATEQEAEASVAALHEKHPYVMTAYDKARQFVRGTPVGSWIDEIGAAIPGSGPGSSYAERLGFQRALDRYADDNSTKVGSLPLIGDVTTGGLTKLAGGVASAPFAPIARGASTLGSMVKGGLSAAGYGTLYGAGEGENASERVGNAATGAAIGGVLGAAAPPLARGFGNAVEALSNTLRPNPSELAGVSRKAVRNVLDDANADRLFEPGAQSYRNQAARMGDEAMIADMGSNLAEHAGGLATKPGISAEIARPIMNRSEGAMDRLTQAVSGAMGRPRSVPEMIDNLVAAGRRDAAPLYDQFYSTQIKPTDRLVNLLQRVPRAAYDKAQQIMHMEGLDPATVGNTGRMIDLIKRGLDDVAQGEVDQFRRTTNTGRVYNNLARDLTAEVDSILSPRNPANSVWAQARKAAGDNKKLQEAFEAGQKAFGKGLSYDQMAHDMRGMSLPEQTLYRAGARTQIHEVMDSASNRSGPSGATAGMRTLGSTQADKKLRDLAVTPQAGENLSRVRDAEATFANTTDTVLKNSKTAVRTEQAKRYNLDANDSVTGHMTELGTLMVGVKKVVDTLAAGYINESRIKLATDAASMLVAQGARRDEIINGLIKFRNAQGITGAQRTAATVLVNRLIHGGRGALIDSKAYPSQATTR